MINPLDEITRFYLESHRFNGFPFANLEQDLGLNFDEAVNFVKDQVANGRLTVVFGDVHPNSHIKAFPDEPSSVVIEKLNKYVSHLDNHYHICLYPTRSHLLKVVNPDNYRDCPYTYEMALGAGQLEFRYFDLTVLEFYRNDPRYYYRCDDINGSISIHDEHYHSSSIAEKDKVLLETFGFAYDKDLRRAVTTFVYYISKLSPEHQQVWKNRELNVTEYKPHPDYYRNNVLGDWGERIPICTALLMEIKIINQMCLAMDKPPLFRKEFDDYDKPRYFSFLVRPTLKEYYDFVGILDKIISDNIDKQFFQNDIPLEDENTRPDGKIEVIKKGTIRLLEEWIKKYYRPSDGTSMDEIFTPFRTVRKERQKPAHAIDDDNFDQKYFTKQRQILDETYNAIRTIRLIFANHPAVQNAKIDIPQVLFDGKIWSF